MKELKKKIEIEKPELIIHGDCLENLKQIPDKSIDLILTDPPYESLEKWRNMGTTTRLGGHRVKEKQNKKNWFTVFSNSDLPDLIQETYRILKNNRHAYFFCDFETLKLLYKYAITEKVFPSSYGGLYESCKPLIWDKVYAGMGYTYRAKYEFILMFWKGKKRQLNDLSIPDILQFPRVHFKQRLVPTQKPLDLCKLLIKQSTKENEIILDMFAGSGTSLLAAKQLNRFYIGIEISEKYCEIIKERLK